MKQSVANDIRYVKYICSMYIKDKPELEVFREDLEQEGMMGLLSGRDAWDVSKGYDRPLWLHYMCMNAMKGYLRKAEIRHFKGAMPSVTSDSEEEHYDADVEAYRVESRWDLEYTPSPDDLVSDSGYAQEDDRLHHYTDRVDISEYARSVLGFYLTCGCYTTTSKHFGVSRQAVTGVIENIIEKCKELPCEK
jgi:hypothetical protein